MKHTLFLATVLALALSACSKKQEAQPPMQTPEAAAPATPAPESAMPTTPAPQPAAPETAAATQAPAAVAAMPAKEAAAGDTAAGAAKFKTVCASCHGAQAQGQGAFPRLAGQSAAELKAKLEKYRAGEKMGAMTATMAPMAKSLSDADVDNVTAYIATLK
jgi:cytochrome c553